MSKKAIGYIAEQLRNKGYWISESFISYDKSKDTIQMNITDKSKTVEYESDKRLSVYIVNIDVFSPIDADREPVYEIVGKVKEYLESILNANYDGGVIRMITNVTDGYKGATVDGAIVYGISCELTDEVNLY